MSLRGLAPQVESVMGMFNKTSPVKTVAPSPKSKLKADKVHIEGLAELARVGALKIAAEGLYKTLEGSVKEKIRAKYIQLGVKLGARPANFKSEEGCVTGTNPLKDRSSLSPLTEEQQAALTAHEIPFTNSVVREEYFAFNAEKYADQAEAIEEECKKARAAGFTIPEDIFVYHPAEVKPLATKATVDAIFAKKDKALADELIPMATCLALGTTLGVQGLTKEEAQKLFDKLFAEPDEDEEIEEAGSPELMAQLKASVKATV